MYSLSKLHELKKSNSRISTYQTYEQLYEGRHFEAFKIKKQDDQFTQAYAKLRYVVCNFAGLVSKVSSDFLFGEPVQFTDENNQEFIDVLVFENNLNTLFYEHSLANSYLGDNLFKIRVEDGIIRPEDAQPELFIPEIDSDNFRAKPSIVHLVWHIGSKDNRYIVDEIHEPPLVRTRAGQITKDGVSEVKVDQVNEMFGKNYQAKVDTKIDRFLVKHVPNPKARGFWGDSDYKDLKPLIFALNNRMSKIDNILDKHSDPILAVPDGVLDEDGKVRSAALQMFEMDDQGKAPEYIVWNANLDSAFKQIDKMVEFLFMFSETSPDVLGLGKGQAESGRALKMRLLRTLAKRNRKKIYYDPAIKDLILTAEMLAKANGYKASESMDVKVGEPAIPETRWQDGVVNDEVEKTDIVVKKTESGLMSKKRGVMELEEVTGEEAKAIMSEVDDEKADFVSMFDKSDDSGNDGQ